MTERSTMTTAVLALLLAGCGGGGGPATPDADPCVARSEAPIVLAGLTSVLEMPTAY